MCIWTILFVVLLIVGDRWVYRVPCGRRLDSSVAGACRDFIDSAFCHGGADGLMIGLSSEKPHRRKAAGLFHVLLLD